MLPTRTHDTHLAKAIYHIASAHGRGCRGRGIDRGGLGRRDGGDGMRPLCTATGHRDNFSAVRVKQARILEALDGRRLFERGGPCAAEAASGTVPACWLSDAGRLDGRPARGGWL